MGPGWARLGRPETEIGLFENGCPDREHELIEIVKGLGANNVLTESFGQVFFWNHILNLGLGAGQGGGG